MCARVYCGHSDYIKCIRVLEEFSWMQNSLAAFNCNFAWNFNFNSLFRLFTQPHRCCPEIEKLYLLVRPKKGREPRERLGDIFGNPVSSFIFQWSSVFCNSLYFWRFRRSIQDKYEVVTIIIAAHEPNEAFHWTRLILNWIENFVEFSIHTIFRVI